MSTCELGADDKFGPRVIGCRDDFDFTLLFEQAILSTPLTVIAILVCIHRISILYKQSVKTRPASSGSNRPILKQIPLAGFMITQLVLVALWSSSSNATKISVAASALSMTAGLALATLSFIHHSRAVRPSGILNAYLAFSTLFDLAQARTLWLRYDHALASVFTTGLVCKALALFAEMREKRKILREPYANYPPEALGGVINRSVFWWINSLLLKGRSSSLELEDLYELDEELSFDHLHAKFRQSWHSNVRRNPSTKALIETVFRCFWKQISYIVFYRLCLIAFNFCQPLLIHRALSLLLEPEDSPNRKSVGYALIGATSLIYIGIAVTTGLFKHNLYRLITMLRGSLVGLIYETTLRIDPHAAKDSAAITLMSTDIDCMATGVEEMDAVWASPIEIAISIYLLYQQVGLASITPIGIALVVVLISITLRKISTTSQKSWLEATQRRVAITSMVLSNIKPIKMMGLTDNVGRILQNLRVSEIKVAGKFRTMLTVSLLIATTSLALIPFLTLTTYALMMRSKGDIIKLSPVVAFTTLSLVSLLATPIRYFVKGIPKVAAAFGCFQRIQKYLLMSHINPEIESGDRIVLDSHTDKIELQGLAVSKDKRVPLLSIDKADFILPATTTPILRNITLSITSGTWTILAGPIGCGKSLLLLAIINELRHIRGTVSRSQFLEIGYCSQDPWLPNLSIKNLIVAHSPWNQELYSSVLDACLLRRDLQELPQGDQQVIGSKGLSLSGGQKQRLSLARALYSRKQLLVLDDILGGLDPKTEQSLVNNVFGNEGFLRKHSMTALLATHSIRHVRRADHVIIMAQGGLLLSKARPVRSIPSNILQMKIFLAPNVSEVQHESQGEPVNQDMESDLSRRTGDFRLYLYYFKAIGWATSSIALGSVILMAVFLKLTTLWVQWWSESEQINPGKQTNMHIGVWGLICALAIMSTAFGLISLLHFAMPHTSVGLHQRLVDTVMRAPYWFLVSTDTGNLVNRFSQDMSLICLQLPFALEDTMLNFSFCVLGLILITLASKWSMTMYPPLIVVLYFLQRFYLMTSRQLRLLDLEAKSPLYSDFIQTLQGVVTIRAFGWQHAATAKSAALLDKSQRPFYLMYSIQRWLNLVLDLLVAAVATMIVALATQLNDSSAGALGVALLNILRFSSDLVDLIRTWTELETSLGAISRIRAFENESPSERLPGERVDPPAQWPFQGLIQIENLSSSYMPDSEPILKNICLEIEPGSKVGVCGRTGSGKSTFLLTMLRMAEVQSGDILIDGISVKSMPRNVARRRIITMPQEALFLPGSVRSNVDPLNEHPDEAIFSALNEVGILDIIIARGGLSANMEAMALSHGQQQLFCLTRVILSSSKIVLLDEITSSVDAVTEAKMMEVVERTFHDRTVVAIAHHLHTIRNFDKIIVLDKGCVVEVGSPDELLGNPLSVFRELWERNH
uniref:ABC transporter n=1 Tax=Bionectria ochroleuca TaxID=29856 RepID=A0A8H7N605_BIOOC